jgi:hypothetical protein
MDRCRMGATVCKIIIYPGTERTNLTANIFMNCTRDCGRSEFWMAKRRFDLWYIDYTPTTEMLFVAWQFNFFWEWLQKWFLDSFMTSEDALGESQRFYD